MSESKIEIPYRELQTQKLMSEYFGLFYEPMISVVKKANELGLKGKTIQGIRCHDDFVEHKTVFTFLVKP